MKSMKPQEPLIRVVDDEEEVRDSLKFMLECEGWLVSAYASGFDLLKDFDRSRPGCILLDVRMPDLSGPELQEKLNLMGSRVPIVFITSYSDIHAAIATLKAGADDFLLKPVDPEKLLEVVAHTVERSQLLGGGSGTARKSGGLSSVAHGTPSPCARPHDGWDERRGDC